MTAQPPQTTCAYLGQYHVEQFRRDLEEILRSGIARVYFPLTEDDMLLRRANLETMSTLAREAGIETWMIPWGVGGVFAGPRGTSFVAHHLDARQIDSVGESLPAACPNNPRFAHYIETWIEAAIESGAQGILLDEPVWLRHPTLSEYRGMDTSHLWTCRCEHCQRRFHTLYRGGEMPEEMDDEVRDFRARTLAAFLRDMGESAWRRGVSSGLRISRYGSVTTWEILARQSWCSEISLAAYLPLADQVSRADWDFGPSDEEEDGTQDARMQEFERQIEAGVSLLLRLKQHNQARTFFWLRCFQLPESDEPLIRPVVQRLRTLGAEDFAIWSFGGTASIGALACERPGEVWKATLDAIHE